MLPARLRGIWPTLSAVTDASQKWGKAQMNAATYKGRRGDLYIRYYVETGSEVQQTSCPLDAGAPSPGVKILERELDYLPSYTTEIRNVCYTFMV